MGLRIIAPASAEPLARFRGPAANRGAGRSFDAGRVRIDSGSGAGSGSDGGCCSGIGYLTILGTGRRRAALTGGEPWSKPRALFVTS